MADGIKISEMTEVTGLLGSDLIPLVSEGQNRKIAIDNLRKALFPIGSKYISPTNPSTFLGGTWEASEFKTVATPDAYDGMPIFNGHTQSAPQVFVWTRTA